MSLAVGRDILEEASSDLLDSLAVSHPALAFLASSELRWPNIRPPASASRGQRARLSRRCARDGRVSRGRYRD